MSGSRPRALGASSLAVVVFACAPGSPTGSTPGTPSAVLAHAGADQQSTVGTTVPVRPALRITDANGVGIPGMVVTFDIVSGGGTLTAPVDTTDAQGIAEVGAWTLGPTPGEQLMRGRTPGLPEVVFRANALAGAGSGQLVMDSTTHLQSAPVGTAVARNPALVVRSAAGQPVAGVAVTFTVAQGGGSIAGGASATATSDAQGRATAGPWQLGGAEGVYAVTATAPGYTPVTLTATARALTAPQLTRTVFLGGLQAPWDMAFTPDGDMLYTERGRGLSVRRGDGSTRLVWRPADLVAESQSGMLGLALDPQFATNRFIYLYIASNLGGATANRVVRVAVNADYSGVTGRADLVTGITYANGGAHSGGRVRVGPDGFLYVTTGDTRTGSVPQNLQALGGKVLRVDRQTGGAAPGNGAPAGADPRIFAFGFRNVQGIDFRPGTGQPFTSEHGPGYHDEVTPLAAGGNGGWHPLCQNGTDYCGYDGSTRMTDSVRYASALRPAWTTGNASLGMAGGAFLLGAQWGTWNGAFVTALLSGRRLEVLALNAQGRAIGNTPLFGNLGQRLRSVTLGPDGALYVATDGRSGGDEIWRVVAAQP